MDNKIKHLEMILAIINRMNHCSFLLKGWSVVIISAILALATKDCNKDIIFVAFVPALIFWVLDAFFLWQERLFRALYDRVRCSDESDIDFSMNTSEFQGQIRNWFQTLGADTILIFHGCVTVIIIMALIVTN